MRSFEKRISKGKYGPKKEEGEKTNMDNNNIKLKDKKYKLKEVLKINCPRGCNLKITIKGDNAKVTDSKRY